MLTDQCGRQTGKQIRVLECYGMRPVGGFSSQSGPSPTVAGVGVGRQEKEKGKEGWRHTLYLSPYPLWDACIIPAQLYLCQGGYCIFFFSICGLLQDIDYSSLCYTAGPHCLSILYIIICLPVPALNLSLPYPSPLASTSLLYVCEPVL